MDDFVVIGKSVVKKDSLHKVLGKTKFAGDMEFENMLYGEVVRSTVASAYIKKIDTSKALKLDGVIKILTYKDIPGKNRIGIILKDEPVLVDDKVRRIGDAIALVAAKTKEIARKAAGLVEIEYEEIEPIFSFERAMEEDSPKIHGTSNILNKKTLVHGDIDKGFEQCDVIVENTYKTSRLSHMFIEPEAGVAKYENGIITVYSSTQNPHFDRGEIASTLNFPNNRVRSIQATTGGGFGGKLDISVQCHLALLAYYTERPVKMVRSRKESTCVSSKRHAMTMTARTGATKDGKILAHHVIMTADTGAYASYGPAVVTRAMVHCTGPYMIPNVRVETTFAYTNNPMGGAFRGFGVPQVAVLHEGQIEALAKKLNIDSIKLRLLNAQKVGSETATGQILKDSVGLVECINKAVEKANEVMKCEVMEK
ncbi:Xanthine dehydrogenase [Clostridium sp. DL-VIII]|uniref:xanthine dehydrogenase family protein molybdopterin-binding subunit n=1 Tax=Clostridium sp. DL-VIII TaxID=641107 RepID=UPI00023AF34F|nr:molybdopterin cofactor-binding domain-containing protein [Clostridium sp. DL-VIII]EHI97721.1 Xanthine dehydrogenase [Clostridium sp. DL-VIII]